MSKKEHEMSSLYQDKVSPMQSVEASNYLQKSESLIDEGEEKGLFLDKPSGIAHSLSKTNRKERAKIDGHLSGLVKNEVEESKSALSKQFKRKSDQYLLTKMIEGAKIPNWNKEKNK